MSDLTTADLRLFSHFVQQMVELRLNAGHHPQDVVLSAWDIYEAVSRVYVDGAWPAERGASD